MKFSVRSLLKDKNVLRIVSLISVLNLMGYIMVRDLESVSFFVLVGFLATHFSKNMIIVLLVSIISTNFLTMSKKARTVYEGMTGKNSKKSKSKEKSKKRILDMVKGASTVVIVSHSFGLMTDICDRVILLHKGKVVHDGAPQDSIKEYYELEGGK